MSASVDTLPLGEIVKPTRPRVKPADHPALPFIGMEHIEAHTMKLLGTVPAAAMKSSAVHFKAGDVLYGRLRPYLNKVYRPAFEGLCSAEFIVLPETERLDGKYLQYFLNSSTFVRFASHLNAGDRPRVDFDQIAAHELPLPRVDVQRSIVAEIEKQFSRLDEAVANLQRVKANLKRYTAAVLTAATEGTLGTVGDAVPEPFESRVDGASAGKQDLTPLPPSWSWSTAGAAIDAFEAGASFKCVERPPEDGEVGVLKVSALTWGTYDEQESKTCMDPSRVNLRYVVKPGDFLFSRANTVELVGACVIVGAVTKQLMLSDKTLRLRINPTVAPAWLQCCLRSKFGRAEIERLATGNQESMRNIGQERIRQIRIPLPPLAEQHRIVAEVDRRLSIVGEVEAEVDANLKRALALRQAVLRRAFSGELVTAARQHDCRPALTLIPGTASLSETARVALSAEIVHRLWSIPRFGRVKHQKIYFLCEHIAQLEPNRGKYQRAAAGPLDLSVIEANCAAMERLGWYAERQRDGAGRHEYMVLSNAGAHSSYLSCFSDNQLKIIRRLIDLMRDWSTDHCEMFATVYAAWNDLLLFEREATPEAVVREVEELWDDKKLRFTRQQWLDQVAWIARQGFVPTGFGRPTRSPTDGVTDDMFPKPSR